jgi:hypothetical protein
MKIIKVSGDNELRLMLVVVEVVIVNVNDHD